eukprot:m.60346 g.60346  ORF g.60346 m.60346 type:complete len:124 (+) comp12287_c0_seq3:122-493(+)
MKHTPTNITLSIACTLTHQGPDAIRRHLTALFNGEHARQYSAATHTYTLPAISLAPLAYLTTYARLGDAELLSHTSTSPWAEEENYALTMREQIAFIASNLTKVLPRVAYRDDGQGRWVLAAC